jgi:dynein intermediate chain 3, axonemal
MERAIQQNEIVDIFCDDYLGMGEDEPILDRGHHTMLQEYQSFTDLKNSKNHCISCIDWHPTQKGIVAVSCISRYSYEDRVDMGCNIRPKASLILVWSFQDPIHPQVLVE